MELFSLLDLTSLNEEDTETSIEALCQKAYGPLGEVAAVCIYPQFISAARESLRTHPTIKIATVANFPSGTLPLEHVLTEIKTALTAGANEIDVVMPYPAYLAGDTNVLAPFVTACKQACGDYVLKVILESGAFNNQQQLADASRTAIVAGADFIKTSTGKIAEGATPAAAETMLNVIRELHPTHPAGFKAAGGIRTPEQANTYVQLAAKIMGKHWISPATFRIGTSRLAG